MEKTTLKDKLSAESQTEELVKLSSSTVGETSLAEKREWEAKAFQRRSRVSRSPPMRDRSFSLPDCVVEGGRPQFSDSEKDLTISDSSEDHLRPAKKRKNIDTSPIIDIRNPKAGEKEQSKSGRNLNELYRTITNVHDLTKKLTQLIKENPNTQRGIKKAVESLEYSMGIVARESKALHSASLAKPIPIKKELVNSSTQTEEENVIREAMTSVSTQTNPRKAGTVQSLKYVKTFTEWEEIADKQWDKDLLSSTKLKDKGNLLNTDPEVVKLCWIDRRESHQNSYLKALKDKYPELMNAEGDFEVLEQTSKLRIGGGSFTQKIIKVLHEGTEKGVWEKLTKVREEMEGRTRLAMHAIPGITVQRLRKLASWVFCDTTVQTEICVDLDDKRKAPPTIPLSKPTRNTYALIVEDKGKLYKEVLEKVKPVLKNTSLSKHVKGLRSTREGNKLVISLEKDEEILHKIKSLIGNSNQSMQVRALGDVRTEMKPIHLKGMDALTTKEDVVAAIESKIGPLTGRQFRLSELRPNINNTRAITVWTESGIADKLTEDGLLRVGMANCRAEEKIIMKKCKRCWEYGHKAKECEGQDLTKACYKCGQNGHEAKECEREDECPLCRTKGHRADTGKCKVFLRALADMKRSRRRLRSQITATNIAHPLDGGQTHTMVLGDEEILSPLDTDVFQASNPTGVSQTLNNA